MKKFEYRVLDVAARGFFGGRVNSQALVEKPNELGREGWEVISASDTNTLQGASRSLILVLKRQIPE